MFINSLRHHDQNIGRSPMPSIAGGERPVCILLHPLFQYYQGLLGCLSPLNQMFGVKKYLIDDFAHLSRNQQASLHPPQSYQGRYSFIVPNVLVTWASALAFVNGMLGTDAGNTAKYHGLIGRVKAHLDNTSHSTKL